MFLLNNVPNLKSDDSKFISLHLLKQGNLPVTKHSAWQLLPVSLYKALLGTTCLYTWSAAM